MDTRWHQKTQLANGRGHQSRTQSTGVAEQALYEHLLRWADRERPDQLIERFRSLFIEGAGYPDAQVSRALDIITDSATAEAEFRFVLNRCCHILINRWQARSQMQAAIPDLVDLFEATPSSPLSVESSRVRSVRQLRKLVQSFTETEQYLTLQRLAHVVSEATEGAANVGDKPLGSLIRRYPYIYPHCLLSEDSSREHQSTIRAIQRQAQKKYDLDLSRYIAYQVRQVRQSQGQARGNRHVRSSGAAHSVENPTLLNNRELSAAVRQFAGRVDGRCSYRDLAQRFTTQSRHTRSYKAFKGELYEYITDSVDPGYGNRRFNNLLHKQLVDTLPDSDNKRPDDFLMVRTYSQLLGFLVVDSMQKPEHFVFVDLINNLGPVFTTGLLLKIVLLCNRVRPVLEKRFSILFSHYESCTQDVVRWLVQMLENLNVALSLNFGSMDLSFLY